MNVHVTDNVVIVKDEEDKEDICSCVSYYPDSECKLSEYGMLLFISPYFQSQNDYQEIRIQGTTSTAGWIIPVNQLEETDIDEINILPTFLKKFADIAIKKLLVNIATNKEKSDLQNNNVVLSEIYSDEIFIFIFRTSIINNTDIYSYIPALFEYGFTFIDDNYKKKISELYISEIIKDLVAEHKSEKRHVIKLKKSKYYDNNKAYFDETFINLLPYSQNVFLRYIVLYQFAEILMGYSFNNLITNEYTKYQQGKIDKNTLKEKFIESTKEITRLNELFTGQRQNQIDFRQIAKDLLKSIDTDCTGLNTFAEYMYKIRNKIVHDMPELIPYSKKIKSLVDLLETIIFDFLVNTNYTEQATKQPFIIDTDLSLKANKKQLKLFYDNIKYPE